MAGSSKAVLHSVCIGDLFSEDADTKRTVQQTILKVRCSFHLHLCSTSMGTQRAISRPGRTRHCCSDALMTHDVD